jgi:hypothetical protein
MKKLSILFAFCLGLIFAQSAFGQSGWGKWNLTAKADGQMIPITLELKQEGAFLKGSLSSPIGGGVVKSAQITGNLFTGTASVNFQGQQMEIALKGTIDGDKMTGTISGTGLPAIPFTGIKGK